MVTLKERRREPRVIFAQPPDVLVMTIDGTWSGEDLLMEMTDAGARLKMTGHASELTEFFLILNRFGPPAFRICKRIPGMVRMTVIERQSLGRILGVRSIRMAGL